MKCVTEALRSVYFTIFLLSRCLSDYSALVVFLVCLLFALWMNQTLSFPIFSIRDWIRRKQRENAKCLVPFHFSAPLSGYSSLAWHKRRRTKRKRKKNCIGINSNFTAMFSSHKFMVSFCLAQSGARRNEVKVKWRTNSSAYQCADIRIITVFFFRESEKNPKQKRRSTKFETFLFSVALFCFRIVGHFSQKKRKTN